MFEIARIKAPAKLNLHLEIGATRTDGFHELISLFQSVSLADELVLRIREEPGVSVLGDFDFPARENIVYKACVLFMERFGVRAGIEVSVSKEIPMGAGMGGGSSDAAASLRALDALFGTMAGTQALSLLGGELGSDVPFFLHGPCAVVGGRGETVEPLAARGDLSFVSVDPGFPVSTKEAYRLWDGQEGRREGGFVFSPERLAREYLKDPAEWGFFNSFFGLLRDEHPVLGAIRDELMEGGAAYATMSGSGSSMFGIFRSAGEAERAKENQEALGRRSRSGFLLARNEDVILE